MFRPQYRERRTDWDYKAHGIEKGRAKKKKSICWHISLSENKIDPIPTSQILFMFRFVDMQHMDPPKITHLKEYKVKNIF